jgi:hypothetical protein
MPSVGNYFQLHMFYILGIAIVILGAVLTYGMIKTGRPSECERKQLERKSLEAQRRDDPQKTSTR